MTHVRTLTFSIALLASSVAVLIASRILASARSLKAAKEFMLVVSLGTRWCLYVRGQLLPLSRKPRMT